MSDSPEARKRRRSPPPGDEQGFLDTTGGTRIRYMLWPGETARGTVVFVTGFHEFIDKYFEAVADLRDRGFAVAAMDWRGQGLSTRHLPQRQRIFVNSFDEHLSDFQMFMDQVVKVRMPVPRALIGHSMGGHLSLRHLHDHPDNFLFACLSAPMVRIRMMPVTRWLSRRFFASKVKAGKGGDYAPGQRDYDRLAREFLKNVVTSDRERFADEGWLVDQNPDLAGGGATYGWLHAAMQSTDVLNRHGYAEDIHTPVLICSAGRDLLVSNKAQRRLVAHMPEGEIISIDGAKHEILKEKDIYRNQFWAGFDRLAAHYMPE